MLIGLPNPIPNGMHLNFGAAPLNTAHIAAKTATAPGGRILTIETPLCDNISVPSCNIAAGDVGSDPVCCWAWNGYPNGIVTAGLHSWGIWLEYDFVGWSELQVRATDAAGVQHRPLAMTWKRGAVNCELACELTNFRIYKFQADALGLDFFAIDKNAGLMTLAGINTDIYNDAGVRKVQLYKSGEVNVGALGINDDSFNFSPGQIRVIAPTDTAQPFLTMRNAANTARCYLHYETVTDTTPDLVDALWLGPSTLHTGGIGIRSAYAQFICLPGIDNEIWISSDGVGHCVIGSSGTGGRDFTITGGGLSIGASNIIDSSNSRLIVGSAQIGRWPTDGTYATFRNAGLAATGLTYALLQGLAGDVRVNAPTGQMVDIYNNNTTLLATFSASLVKLLQRTIQSAPNSAPTDADIDVSGLSFWINEGDGTLRVRARYADGTYKSGSVCALA